MPARSRSFVAATRLVCFAALGASLVLAGMGYVEHNTGRLICGAIATVLSLYAIGQHYKTYD